MNIEYSAWGLANKIGDTIILNRDLKEYPGLHASILLHERGHSEAIFSNLKHDYLEILDSPLNLWFAKIKFMFWHPRSWVQVLPFMIYKGRPYFDLSVIILYVLSLTIIIVGWSI